MNFNKYGNILTTSRQLKASENIKKILSNIFVSGVFISPDLFELSISVTDVNVSPDLQNAVIKVYPLSSKISPEELVERLNLSSQKIKHLLAQKLYAKRVPNLLFKTEQSFERAEKILDIIHNISN